MTAIGSGTGDLTRRLPDEGRDEVANIARSFNQFVAKLQSVILEIRGASESVRAAANEIAAASHGLSSRTESAAASLQQTAASMDQISGTVDQSASAAREADARSGIATQMASRGGEIVSDGVDTMGEIEDASTQLASLGQVEAGLHAGVTAFQRNVAFVSARSRQLAGMKRHRRYSAGDRARSVASGRYRPAASSGTGRAFSVPARSVRRSHRACLG